MSKSNLINPDKKYIVIRQEEFLELIGFLQREPYDKVKKLADRINLNTYVCNNLNDFEKLFKLMEANKR